MKLMYSARDEAQISTKKAKASKGARFSVAHDNFKGPRALASTSTKGSQATFRLMPRAYRLSGTEIRSMKVERRFHTPLLSLSVARSNRVHPGIAIVVSKKIAAEAVVRNTIKRRMRAALARVLTRFAPGHQYLFVAKKNIRDATVSEIAASVASVIAP
jgi:ribonuclease P protein component